MRHGSSVRYDEDMPQRTTSGAVAAQSFRQSVTVPAPLAAKVRRVARECNLTMGRAIVALAERGLQAEAEVQTKLKSNYRRFMEEPDAARKEDAGKDLIRAIFGKDAIAEDKIR